MKTKNIRIAAASVALAENAIECARRAAAHTEDPTFGLQRRINAGWDALADYGSAARHYVAAAQFVAGV